MFKRRDIPPVLLLLLLIILVMLTLSQILVVHSGRYGKNLRSMQRLQQELREMDLSLHSLMHQNVPSVERNRRILQNRINSGRFAEILAQASEINAKSQTSKVKANSSRSNFRQRNSARTLNVDSQSHQSAHRKPESPSADAGNSTQKYAAQEPEVSRVSGSEGPNRTSALRQPAAGRESGVTSRNVINYCPSIPPSLKGRLSVNVGLAHNVTVAEVMRNNPEILPGGKWHPRECVARHKVAVIIPYRDREDHLILLLSQLHPILQRQQLDYRIFVVEQFGADTFNKARIMNIGFVEALKLYDFQCFIFHDVDLVPEDDRNMYSCPVQPRHMSVAIDEMGYRLAYQELVGGVLNMRTSHFQRLNGYSNLYWGWGAEDDDMAYRIMHVGLRITRPRASIARYKMIKHPKRKPSDWRKRAKLLYTVTRRIQYDGLNSLTYRLVEIRDRPLYTHVLAEIGKPPRGFRDNKSAAS